MNLLREYIRETLLTESVHPKIMEMIDALERAKGYVEILPDRVIVWEPTEISPQRWVAMVAYETTAGARAGGKCGGAGGVVQSSTAKTGMGPLAYDVAIEAQEGMGLISDRSVVSREARAVWNYYMNNRPDVVAVQLDDQYNTLTPEDEDNCNQQVAISDEQGNRMPKNWKDDALSKLYKKSGTPVMDELRKRGMLK
tara:strand:- start:500 stop:1090 length:591 start_codon:yes stop_codon:yes gene_type:complete